MIRLKQPFDDKIHPFFLLGKFIIPHYVEDIAFFHRILFLRSGFQVQSSQGVCCDDFGDNPRLFEIQLKSAQLLRATTPTKLSTDFQQKTSVFFYFLRFVPGLSAVVSYCILAPCDFLYLTILCTKVQLFVSSHYSCPT